MIKFVEKYPNILYLILAFGICALVIISAGCMVNNTKLEGVGEVKNSDVDTNKEEKKAETKKQEEIKDKTTTWGIYDAEGRELVPFIQEEREVVTTKEANSISSSTAIDTKIEAVRNTPVYIWYIVGGLALVGVVALGAAVKATGTGRYWGIGIFMGTMLFDMNFLVFHYKPSFGGWMAVISLAGVLLLTAIVIGIKQLYSVDPNKNKAINNV